VFRLVCPVVARFSTTKTTRRNGHRPPPRQSKTIYNFTSKLGTGTRPIQHNTRTSESSVNPLIYLSNNQKPRTFYFSATVIAMDVKLEPHLQRKLEQNVINSTMKQNVDLMSKIADQCFNECVNHFPSRMLSKGESKCIENCADRFIVLSQRVGKQYQEVQHQVVVKEKLKQMEFQQQR